MPLLSQNKIKQLCIFAWLLLAFTACTTGLQVASSKFTSANEVTEMKANVILADNTTMNGYLTLNALSSNQPATIRFPKQRTSINVPIANIKGYEIEDVHYALKLIEPVTTKLYLWGKPTAQKCFVKKLTPDEFPIQLFSSDEKIADTKSNLINTVTHYYVAFNKNDNEVLLDVMHHNFVSIYHQEIQKISAQNPMFAAQFQSQKKVLQKNIGSKTANNRMKILYKVAQLHATTTKL